MVRKLNLVADALADLACTHTLVLIDSSSNGFFVVLLA
jgi:hypothetical protein